MGGNSSLGHGAIGGKKNLAYLDSSKKNQDDPQISVFPHLKVRNLD